jgi:putative protease
MSHAVTGRSGNRGVCAQPCRSHYTLTDGGGKVILAGKFLLSLKDLNLMSDIPALVAAGVTSFKIEGRYKEIDYVKNVTAAYSQALDDFVAKHPAYRRGSSGKSEILFSPDPTKTFNRGFTKYFIAGRREKVASIDTPKSIGQPVGTVTGAGKGFFLTDCRDLKNGDGLCFFTGERNLSGFRVERVEGSKIFPNTMKGLAKGVHLFRNHDAALTRLLNKISGRRRISAEMDFARTGDTIRLAAEDEDGNRVESVLEMPYVEPRDPSMAREQIEKHLSGTGHTPFKVAKITISDRIGFFTISFLNSIKRKVLENLENVRFEKYPRKTAAFIPNNVPYPEKALDYRANVFNERARRFYERHGAEVAEPAFEILPEKVGREVMRTKHCLLYELDACAKSDRSRRKFQEPLRISDGHHAYLLRFDCEACRMSVIFLGKKIK